MLWYLLIANPMIGPCTSAKGERRARVSFQVDSIFSAYILTLLVLGVASTTERFSNQGSDRTNWRQHIQVFALIWLLAVRQ